MQDGIESGAESGVKIELVHAECSPGCFPDLSSSGSNGADEERISSSREVYGLLLPLSEASKGAASEGTEDLDAEDAGFRHGEEVNGDGVGGMGVKVPKRPDKAVACPRCRSLDTKFCYYNNYNVNQPRHFCKQCQRYWTAGGTLRNVPVGAGRRKNKHGSVVSPKQTPDLALVRGDEPDVASPSLVGKGVQLPAPVQVPVVQAVSGGSLPCSKPPVRGSVPACTSEGNSALPYSMRVPSMEGTFILTSVEGVKATDSGPACDLHCVPPPAFDDVASNPDEVDGICSWPSKDGFVCATGYQHSVSTVQHSVKCGSGAPAKHSTGGDVTAEWRTGGAPGIHSAHSAHSATGSFGFFNGGWPYGYNVGWSGGAALCTGGVASVGNTLAPLPPANVAAWSGAGAGSMWTGMPWPMPGLSWSPAGWGPPPWSIGPWAMGTAASGTSMAMSPATPAGVVSGLATPISCPTVTAGPSLGKHARALDGSIVDGTVWAPKSLRMADPEEAMRSSVWRILGVGSHSDLTSSSTFKAFQPKTEHKKTTDGDQQIVQTTLHANPAAMSRSMYFHESN